VNDALLFLAADVLDDIERTRIANENRVRSMEQAGLGGTPQAVSLAEIVTTFRGVEHAATLSLRRAVRLHPLGDWIKTTVGIGEKQGARLLATIGDPYWNTLHGRPRTVSELWAYCGFHVVPAGQACSATRTTGAGGDLGPSGDPSLRRDDTRIAGAGVAARRRRGVRDNWSNQAKMRAYLIAVSCVKQRESPYRETYEKRRAHTEQTHPDWVPAHAHNDALRIVAKEVLRDLWREAKRLYETRADQVRAS
jgi:hypothetical protein